MRVENMVSPRTGREVANQFIITADGMVAFQSYASEIITINYHTNEVLIGEDWDYSMTTGKYRNAFLAEYFPELASLNAIRACKEMADENGETLFVDKRGNMWKIIFR
jgi:hypothetical protein